jgi:hypothetical protein
MEPFAKEDQMTRDEIIRMAREATMLYVPVSDLERFAALVAAAERESEAAKWIKGAKIKVPTETMEQHFSAYHRRGYEAGKALIPAAVAAERNKLAAWMMANGYATGHGDTTEDLLGELEWQIAEGLKMEREACAQIAEEWLGPVRDRELHIAAAIRARGKA